MAIVPLRKVTLYGTDDQKDIVLDGLQELGSLHLVDLGKEVRPRITVPTISTETHQALKFLRNCPIRRRPVTDCTEFRLEDVVQNALRIDQRQQELLNSRDELSASIRVLKPWGEFLLPPAGDLGESQFWFYLIPHYRLKLLESKDLIWQVVSRDHQFAYVVVISPTEPDGMPAPLVHLDGRPLSELYRALEAVEAELEELHWQRVALTRWTDCIRRMVALADDVASRQHAAEQSLSDSGMFVVRGWSPLPELDPIRSFAEEHSLALTIEHPSPQDSPPTLLSNAEFLSGGEDAVTFYTTPAYSAWDPSRIVFVSFSLFFAMIMADAGYAIVLGGVLLLLWRKLGKTDGGTRFRRFGFAVIVTSIGYGALIGSYFGSSVPKSSLLQNLHVIDAADTQLMMRLSITIGVVHLVLANLALAWNTRWTLRMLSSLGWCALLFGGLAFGFGSTEVEPRHLLVHYGRWAIIAGAASILLFSSNRPFWTLRLYHHWGRLLDGLKALTNVSRAFGDVLSYLRLFALGLASAQLAATFNQLTYQASCCVGFGGLLAVIVAVFGHGLNLALAVMSGVVHGLRLNCIEFFGWGLPEEGYLFHPFRKTAV